MAILDYKKTSQNGKVKNPEVSFNDIFDTQEYLDKDPNNTVVAGRAWNEVATSDIVANKDNFGTILGLVDPINANKKRRKEQSAVAANGFSSGNSVLGGGGF